MILGCLIKQLETDTHIVYFYQDKDGYFAGLSHVVDKEYRKLWKRKLTHTRRKLK